MRLVVIGGGFTGLWVANIARSELDLHVTVLEAGGHYSEATSKYLRRWETRGALFGGGPGGLLESVGGRSNCWDGVSFRGELHTIRASSGGAGWKDSDISYALDHASRLLDVRAHDSNVADKTSEWLNLPLAPLPRARGPFRWRDHLSALAGLDLRVSSSVRSIAASGDGLEVMMNSGPAIKADKVVLAAGTIENCRLRSSAILAESTEASDWNGGLGDHAVVGYVIRAPKAGLEEFVGLDAYLLNSATDHSYQIIQIRDVSEDSLEVDVWGFVEVGMGVNQGVEVVRRAGEYYSIVRFNLSDEDRDRIGRFAAGLSELSLMLTGRFDLRRDGLSPNGPPDFLLAPHYDDLLVTDRYNGWQFYHCAAGTVQHEFGGNVRNDRQAQELPVMEVGGSAFPSIGGFNPTLSFLAAAELRLRDFRWSDT